MIPKSVMIGGMKIPIFLLAVDTRLEYGTRGIYDSDKNEIVIFDERNIEPTVAHELLHVIMYLSGTEYFLKHVKAFSDCELEMVIRGMENYFFQFLKDNTDFFDKPSEINT